MKGGIPNEMREKLLKVTEKRTTGYKSSSASSKSSSTKSSSIKSLSSNYNSSPLPKPNEEEDEKRIEIAEKRLDKMKAKGKEIKDKDCANVQDPVSYQRIPKKYAIYVDKQCYDARILYESIQKNGVIPLSNRRKKDITQQEINKITKKAGMKIETEPIKIIDNIGYSVISMTWSPDGSKIAFSTPFTLIPILDINSGVMLNYLRGHTAMVNCVAWSPDGTKLASVSHDKTVRIWDVNTGECVKRLVGHTDWVYSVAWNSDGTKIASGSQDKTIRIWDVQTGEHLKKLKGHEFAVTSVSWSPDDNTKIVSVGLDKNVIIWDITRKIRNPIIKTFKTYTSMGKRVAWSPDGTKIVSGDDTTMQIWNTQTNENISYQYTATIKCITWSPDSTKIASGDWHGMIYIRDIYTGEIMKTFIGHATSTINSIIWSPDGSKIVSGSDDDTIKIWDVSDLAQRGGKRRGRPKAVKKD